MIRANLVLLTLVVVSALGLVTSQHQARKLYNELQVELAQAKRYEEEITRLSVEQSSWSTPSRIEKVAREKLAMRNPEAARTRILATEAIPVGSIR